MEDISKIRIQEKTYNIKDAKARNDIKNINQVLNVEIEKDNFGNYISNYNDNDINNARNSGKIVQAKYTDETSGKTYTYYYSTMENDRKPTFIRTYVENNKTIQILASVNYDKKVNVNKKEVDYQPQIDSTNQEINNLKQNINTINQTTDSLQSQFTTINDEVNLLTGEISDFKENTNTNFETTNGNVTANKNEIDSLKQNKEDITEVITNENGTAIKYANGIMICYMQYKIDIKATHSWGSLYAADYPSEEIKNYPMPYINVPTVSEHYMGGERNAFLSGYVGIGSKENPPGFTLLRPTPGDVGGDYINIIAIGKWK